MRDGVSIAALVAAVSLPIISDGSITPHLLTQSSLQVESNADFEEEQNNTSGGHPHGRNLIELRVPKQDPLPKYLITVDHSKDPGGGYLVGSPFYNKQERRAATPVPTREPSEGPRLTMWWVGFMVLVIATCCACICACGFECSGRWRGDGGSGGIPNQDYNAPVSPCYREGKTVNTPPQSLHSNPSLTAFGLRPPSYQGVSPPHTNTSPLSHPQSNLGTPVSRGLSPQATMAQPQYSKASLMGASMPPYTGHAGSITSLPPHVGPMEHTFDPRQPKPFAPSPHGMPANAMPPSMPFNSMPQTGQSSFAMTDRNHDGVISQAEWDAGQQGSPYQPLAAPPPSGLA